MSGTPTPPPEKTDGSTTGTPATGISQAPTASVPDAPQIFGTPSRPSAVASSNRSPVSPIAALFPGSASASASAPRSGDVSDSGSAPAAPPPITVPNINAHKDEILNLFFDPSGTMKLFKIIYDPVFEPGIDEVNDEKYEEEEATSGGMRRNRPPGPPPPPNAAPAVRIPAQAANEERKRRRTAIGTDAEMEAARQALLDGIVAPPPGPKRGVEGGIDAAFAEVVAKVDFRSRGRSLGSRKAPRPRSRARSAPAGAQQDAIRDAYATSSSQYASYIDAGKRAILQGGAGNVAETVQQVLSIKKFPAFLGLKRSRWEKPNAGTQCGQVPDPMRNKGKCWLCGNPVPIAGGALPGAPAGMQASVCGPDNNFECEHVLPAPFMFFTKTLINNLIPDPSPATKTLLYDSSCKLCNGIKDNGLYLKASWEGGSLKFKPNNENIIVDILMFLVSTRITKGKEVFTGPLDGRLPPWPGIPTTYGHDNPAIALPQAPNVDWPASALLDPRWSRPRGDENDPCGTPWITDLTQKAPRCGGEDDEPSDSDSDGGEEAPAAAAAAAAPAPDRGQAVHFFSLKRVGVPERGACGKYVKLSISQQHFTSIASVGERKFHNLARAAVEYASDVAADDPGVASTLNMDDLTWLVGKNVGVLDLLPISPDWELNLREAAILVSVNNEGSLKAAMKSLQAANIPQDVSRDKAWNWIRGRFEEIHRRMAEVCQYFNDNPVKQREIVASAHSLATTPVLTVDNFIALNRLPNLPPLAGAGGRRLRFTIRRRSETRQTKKNRRRKVIGTLIDDNQVSGTMMDVEMEGGGPGDEEEDRGYSTVESDAIRIPLGKKLKKEDVGRLAAIHETPNPEDDWTDALIRELSYTTKDDEMFTPKYVDLMETTEDGEEIITRTFLDEYGNPKGEPKILDNTLEGGGTGKKRGRNPTPTEGPARQRRRTDLTLDDLKRTPEQKRIAEQIVYTVMTPGKKGITAAMDSVTEIIKRLRPDFKGADRSLFEEGTVPEQCEGVLGTQGNVVGEICWLCGFAMNMYEVEGTGKTNGVDTKDLNTYMSQPSLDRASCEHKLPIKAAHYFQLMYQKLSKRNGQMSADQFERIKTLYGNAHAFCNYVKSEDLFLESVLGVKTFGEFKVNFIRIAGVNRPPTGISEDGYLKRLLMSVRKRDSSTKAISGLLSGNRFYYWGSQVTRMTGTGATHYRNGVMYRIHKMEDFKQAVASQYVNPRPTQTVARDDPGVNIPYTEFKSPSNKTVREWLYEQSTNIVGGLNELRVLLNSERDKLYTEGLQVINRKPFRENVEWWGLVVPYIEANPTEGEDFKHGLHLPLKDQIPEPKYKKPQLVWQPGQLGPQKSGETDRITYDDDAAVSRMPSAAAPAPPPQYDDNELLNVERKPLDESFNYDELLQLPGYTNTQGGGGGGRVSVIIRRRSETRQTKKNRRRMIEVNV